MLKVIKTCLSFCEMVRTMENHNFVLFLEHLTTVIAWILDILLLKYIHYGSKEKRKMCDDSDVFHSRSMLFDARQKECGNFYMIIHFTSHIVVIKIKFHVRLKLYQTAIFPHIRKFC